MKIYNLFIERKEEYPTIEKSTIDIFNKIQPDQDADNIEIFCTNYFVQYLKEFGFIIINNFNEFIDKLKSLIK